MNVFKKEMKANIKSLIIWCCAQVFIIFAGLMKYQGFADSQVDVNALFDAFPEEIMVVFGIGSVDITKVAGFYSVFFLYFMLLAAVINILIFNMVTFAASVFFIAQHNDGDGLIDKVSLTMLALFILQLFFLALGALFGSVLKNTKRATAAASGLVMGFFILSVVVDLYDKLAFLAILTPFKYFEGASLMINDQLSFNSAAILLIVSLVFFGLTFVAFNRRDLST